MIWFDYFWQMVVMAAVITGGVLVYKAIRNPDKD